MTNTKMPDINNIGGFKLFKSGGNKLICEKCNANMNWFSEDSVQGWICHNCGWNLITTDIGEIYKDTVEYSVYIKNGGKVNNEKIKTIARIAGVNFINAREMLIEKHACILKGKAPKVKAVIEELGKSEIEVEVIPKFRY